MGHKRDGDREGITQKKRNLCTAIERDYTVYTKSREMETKIDRDWIQRSHEC
jgi:hypothetical protein